MTPTPKRIRVLHCITRFGLGGAERVAFSIMKALEGETEFAVFTVHGASDDNVGSEMRRIAKENNIRWFTGTALPMKAGGMVPGALALARAVRAFQPDILHFHSETPEACGAMALQLAQFSRGISIVRTIHNCVYWRYWPRIGRWCDRQLAAAHIACVSLAARDEFIRYRRESGAPPPPVAPEVIYNGVADSRCPPHAKPHRADERRILFAGRFEPQKGTDVLYQALPLVRLPAGTRGELTFLGHGAHQPLIQALHNRPPSGWTIAVRGPVANLAEIFSEYDLVVMPSRFEGLGLIAIEATLAGLPVVVTNAPGLQEAVPPEYPWRAAPGDGPSLARSLTAALAETHQWKTVVLAAQEFAYTRFNPEIMRNGYRKIYSRAAAVTSTLTSGAR